MKDRPLVDLRWPYLLWLYYLKQISFRLKYRQLRQQGKKKKNQIHCLSTEYRKAQMCLWLMATTGGTQHICLLGPSVTCCRRNFSLFQSQLRQRREVGLQETHAFSLWASRLQTDVPKKTAYADKQLEKTGQRSQLGSAGNSDRAFIIKTKTWMWEKWFENYSC